MFTTDKFIGDRPETMTRYIRQKCHVVLCQYADNKQTCIRLVTVSGEPMATCTVNLPNYGPLADNEVFIKDYSENVGIEDALANAGIITLTNQMAIAGNEFVSKAIISDEVMEPYRHYLKELMA